MTTTSDHRRGVLATQLFAVLGCALLIPGPGWSQTQNCGVPMPQGEIAWWPLDDAAAPIQDYANTFASTNVYNVALQQPGMVGAGAGFNGTDSYIAFGNGPAITGQGAFTVDAWIKTTDNRGVILQQRQSPGTGVPGSGFNGEYVLSVGGFVSGFAHVDNAICWSTYGDGAFGFNFCAGSVSDGLWHHVAATRETDGTGKIYIDGVLAGSQAAPARTLVQLNVYMGADKRDCPGATTPGCFVYGADQAYLNGTLDEVQIIGRALSQTEIQGLYNAGAAGKTNISVDIKPDGYPNAINLGSNGVVPVAVCSTPAFDPRTIDPASLTLAGAGLGVKGNGSLMYSYGNVASCGSDTTYPDLIVQVVTQALQLTSSNVFATVSANSNTTPTMHYRGCDTIQIVPQ